MWLEAPEPTNASISLQDHEVAATRMGLGTNPPHRLGDKGDLLGWEAVTANHCSLAGYPAATSILLKTSIETTSLPPAWGMPRTTEPTAEG